MILEERQQLILQTLRRIGRLSRWELHDHTRIRPNTVGADVAKLLEAGILHECDAEAEGRGRPRIPLEIDTKLRHVVGLAIRPGFVEAMRIDLLGGLQGTPSESVVSRSADDPDAIGQVAADVLAETINEQTLSVGIAVPGFVDPEGHKIIAGAAAGGEQPVDLQPMYDTAKDLPVALENDMHALAARWLLTNEQDQDEDVLLVYLDDNQLGAAMLINGRPNRGCIIGGNELGHTRLPVETDPSYMGQTGTLESIASSRFLKRQDNRDVKLAGRAETYRGFNEGGDGDAAMDRMIELVAMGIANAVTFMRPNRMVLVSELLRHEPFADAMLWQIKSQVLGEIADRVEFDPWVQAATKPAETAGWLALANLYYQGWDQQKPNADPRRR